MLELPPENGVFAQESSRHRGRCTEAEPALSQVRMAKCAADESCGSWGRVQAVYDDDIRGATEAFRVPIARTMAIDEYDRPSGPPRLSDR